MEKCFNGKEHKFSNNKCVVCQKRYIEKKKDYRKLKLYIYLIVLLFFIGHILTKYNGSFFYSSIFIISVYLYLIIIFKILVIDKIITANTMYEYTLLLGILTGGSIILKSIFNILF